MFPLEENTANAPVPGAHARPATYTAPMAPRKNSRRRSVRPIFRTLTREQILELIDERARFTLGISGEEYMRRFRAGRIEECSADADIRYLADLVAQ